MFAFAFETCESAYDIIKKQFLNQIEKKMLKRDFRAQKVAFIILTKVQII